MPTRTKTREITLIEEGGTFDIFYRMLSGKQDSYDFKGLSTLRKLFSNEKARILHTLKTKSPKSVYELAKILKRDFKSVSEDIKLLERFGFIEMVSEKTGKRERLRPILVVDSIYLHIKI